ncbi:hypothetical protein PC117_g25895 [Phytophthora cactorum]|uniref:Uncharacterized protein n=1 Tax=Phytophthora cactorum TaxID=29920 RepID=A0A8T1AP32_9STRA|nr:hypothetical protein PC117_g25895 [Phytophthora cactorum]
MSIAVSVESERQLAREVRIGARDIHKREAQLLIPLFERMTIR